MLRSNCFGAAGFRRAEYRVDHRHVTQRVFESYRGRAAFADGATEEIALQGVLVAGGNRFHLATTAGKIAAVVDEDVCGLARRSVERNLRLDAAFRAVKAHALLQRHLRAAREDAMSGRELEHRAG